MKHNTLEKGTEVMLEESDNAVVGKIATQFYGQSQVVKITYSEHPEYEKGETKRISKRELNTFWV